MELRGPAEHAHHRQVHGLVALGAAVGVDLALGEQGAMSGAGCVSGSGSAKTPLDADWVANLMKHHMAMEGKRRRDA